MPNGICQVQRGKQMYWDHTCKKIKTKTHQMNTSQLQRGQSWSIWNFVCVYLP